MTIAESRQPASRAKFKGPVRPDEYSQFDPDEEIEKLQKLFKQHKDDPNLLAMQEKIRAENISLEDASAFGRSILRGLVEKRRNIEPPLSTNDIICRCNKFDCGREIARIGKQFKGFCRVTQPGFCRQSGFYGADDKLEVFYDCLSWNTHHTVTLDTIKLLCHANKRYESTFCCRSGHLCNYNLSVGLPPERHPYGETEPTTNFFTFFTDHILCIALIATFFIIAILSLIIRRRPGGAVMWTATTSTGSM